MTILEAMALCEEAMLESRAHRTATTYMTGLRAFCRFWEEEDGDLDAPISSDILELSIPFPAWLIRQYSKSTASVYVEALKNFFEWLVINDGLEPSYRSQVRFDLACKQIRKKREALLPRFPAEDDVSRMLEAVRRLPYGEPILSRNIALLEFLASTGCRVAEACGLRIRDFDQDYKSAIVVGKGSKERRVYVGFSARAALSDYWTERGFSSLDSPAFARHDRGIGSKIAGMSTRTAQKIVGETSRLAGIDEFTPHYFRHAFAIEVLERTGNLAQTQDLMGHASPFSTRHYAKIRPQTLQDVHTELFG